MKIKTLYLGLVGLLLFLTACDKHDDHEPPLDTSMKIGDVVCTDGTIMRLADYKAQNKKANAVVFYINYGGDDAEGKGYAVCLEDIEGAAFCDSLGVKQGTSASLTDYDGNTNTYALYNTTKVQSPMANIVFDYMTYGQSAYIPSLAQMQLLYAMKTVINPYIKACGGTILPDNPDTSWYWTSTEVEGQEEMKAWLFSVASGARLETPKTESHRVRPIITIYN